MEKYLIISVVICIALLLLVFHLRTKLLKEKNRMHYVSHDTLTQIYTWGHMLDAAKALKKSTENRYFIYTDIMDLKLVNELFGRQAGDEIIRNQAELIRKNVPEGALYCRLNNDHFVVIIKEEQYSVDFLSKLKEAKSETMREANFSVQVYFGIYETNDFTESLETMCDKASLALNTIKGSTEQAIAFYDETMMKEALRCKKIVDEFDIAMRRGEFQMYLQPQFRAIDNKLTGAEALVRRVLADGTVIPPGEFIPIYEKTGLICRLDRFMWNEAAERLQKWKEEGVYGHISVNISPIDFKYLNVPMEFYRLIERYDIKPEQMNIEITESAIVADIPGLRRQLSQLQKQGFALEIDDFGSGYSSLNALKDIEADILKIDMGFLRDTVNTERSHIILDSVINMAKNLKMPVVSEGVEKVEHVDILLNMGCDIFQGYYFSRPIPVEEYEKKYI